MLTLNNLKSPKGSHRNTKRLGRGQASGQGKQAGKGHKGQKARSGGGVRLGFEGGNLPLYMRLPKTGVFTNAPFKVECAEVDLELVASKFEESEEITVEALAERNVIKGAKRRLPVKVLAKNKKLDKKLTFSGIKKFSKNAEELIKKAGGAIK